MIFPGAVWDPGRNAGYAAGRNRMRLCVCHYTVGRDSTAIGERGYFHWLVRRDGEIVQFAEADAITWHAGTANQWGPGIEVEYLPGVDDELWTPEAHAATGRLVDWLIGLGISSNFYDGPRIDPSGYEGFLTHRSVQQPDGHSDWWPDLPRSSTTGVPPMFIAWGQTVFGQPAAALIAGHRKVLDLTGPAGAFGVPQPAIDWKAQPGRDAVPLILLDPQSLGALVA